jgi:L-alanine-DL-glutamate epimerase-like enolase superfamily enzyme
VREDVPWRAEIVDRPLATTDGYASPPTAPGIGVELVDAVAEAHPGASPSPHRVDAPDGALLDW